MIKYTVNVEEDGTKFWFLDGDLHREDGPAIEYPDGSKHWCLNGKLHREDGPAFESFTGTKEWWLNGIIYSEEEYYNQLKPVKELTVNEIEALLGHKIKIVGNA